MGFVDFFDDEPDSESRGQRVRECPGCGERLGLAAFFAADPTRYGDPSRAGGTLSPAPAPPPGAP